MHSRQFSLHRSHFPLIATWVCDPHEFSHLFSSVRTRGFLHSVHVSIVLAHLRQFAEQYSHLELSTSIEIPSGHEFLHVNVFISSLFVESHAVQRSIVPLHSLQLSLHGIHFSPY
jgi:hypothetical protein